MINVPDPSHQPESQPQSNQSGPKGESPRPNIDDPVLRALLAGELPVAMRQGEPGCTPEEVAAWHGDASKRTLAYHLIAMLNLQAQMLMSQSRVFAVMKLVEVASNAESSPETIRRAAADLLKINVVERSKRKGSGPGGSDDDGGSGGDDKGGKDGSGGLKKSKRQSVMDDPEFEDRVRQWWEYINTVLRPDYVPRQLGDGPPPPIPHVPGAAPVPPWPEHIPVRPAPRPQPRNRRERRILASQQRRAEAFAHH